MSDTATLPRPATTDNDDEELQAHIVRGKAKLTEALINGTPVRALCGKEWVPCRDPEGLPVCPRCIQIAKDLDLLK